MEMLISKEYILPNPNKKELKSNGFRHNKLIGDSEGDFYSIRFPVLQYHKTTTVDGEIIIDLNSGNVKINAYSYGTNGCYPPFYQKNCSKVYEPIIKKINASFHTMFRKIGIKKTEESK